MKIPYELIVADPPWSFQTWGKDGDGKGAEHHYATMDMQAIQSLPLQAVTAPNAVLLLWCTWPTLPDGIATGIAWGFEYKTLGFIWLKRSTAGRAWHTGLGYWTRANSEPCLLFTKGNPSRVSKGVHQIIDEYTTSETMFPEQSLVARVGNHSQKPERFFEEVGKLFGSSLKRAELFARRERTGWDCYGNEVDGKDIRTSLIERAGS